MSIAQPILEILQRWERHRQQGRLLSAKELCTECPEHSATVARHVHALRSIYSVLNTPPTQVPPGSGLGAFQWPEIEGYLILGVLGQGGMGTVFKAWQIRAKRVVALKMILERSQNDDEARHRFRREA